MSSTVLVPVLDNNYPPKSRGAFISSFLHLVFSSCSWWCAIVDRELALCVDVQAGAGRCFFFRPFFLVIFKFDFFKI